MKRRLAILLLSIGSIAGCKIHRLPALPAERDPSNEQGAVVPYRPPPDVLTTELSTGTDTPTGHEGHDMGGKQKASKPAPKQGHEGHDMGGEEKASKPAPKTGHEGHDMGGPKGTSRSSASRGAP